MSILWWTNLPGSLFDMNRAFCVRLKKICVHLAERFRNVKWSNMTFLKQQLLPLCSSQQVSTSVCSGALGTTAYTASSFGLGLFSGLRAAENPILQCSWGRDKNASAVLGTDNPSSAELSFKNTFYAIAGGSYGSIHSVGDATIANVGNKILMYAVVSGAPL